MNCSSDLKKCGGYCKKWRPIADFDTHVSKGYQPFCRDCNRMAKSTWYNRYRRWTSNKRNKKFGADRISYEQYMAIIDSKNKLCEYCGHPLEQDSREGACIDRKDPRFGYHRGNMAPCCRQCQYTKGIMPYQKWLSCIRGLLEDWGGWGNLERYEIGPIRKPMKPTSGQFFHGPPGQKCLIDDAGNIQLYDKSNLRP